MSFILDALKKSETDRQRNAGPGLHALRVAAPRAGIPAWAVIVALLLAVNLAIGLWFLLRDGTTEPTTAAQPVPAAAQAPAQPPAPVPGSGATPADTNAMTAGSSDPERGIFNPADFEPAVDPASESRAAAARERTTTPAPDTVVPAPAGAPARSPPTRATPPAVRGLPTREDLALEGLAVPEVSMSLHVYDADPAKRFAFVNGNRAQEGSMLPNGVAVESITPEGVILRWQDRRFLLALP